MAKSVFWRSAIVLGSSQVLRLQSSSFCVQFLARIQKLSISPAYFLSPLLLLSFQQEPVAHAMQVVRLAQASH